ncbi:MAG: hypothetical protein RMX96_05130 [Nostoc sp. ChiSLP02]|nr:hypothetical protein [Nostoc sp. DedSLP05]MDZ8103657.1 hypothetical protein [Nostoc sp. DedSLP01]MDZ8184232.1 hypothetical protein [Nostoc sp. ChiSLP02]
MPKKKFADIPFPPVIIMDTDTPVSINQVSNILRERPKGASICIRSTQGHTNRGGYFFHILPIESDLSKCELYNFEKMLVATLPVEQIILFINHCSGLEFNDWVFQFCQSVVNFRLDPAEPESAELNSTDSDLIEFDSLG